MIKTPDAESSATVREAMVNRDLELQVALATLAKAVAEAQHDFAEFLTYVDPNVSVRQTAETKIANSEEDARAASVAQEIDAQVRQVAILQDSITRATRRARQRINISSQGED